MSTTETMTRVETGAAADAQAEAVEKRRGSRPRTGGTGTSIAKREKAAAPAVQQTFASLTFDELLAISTVLVAASTDDVTPVITTVQLIQTKDRITAYGTDRYRVASVDFPRAESARGEFEVLLSRDLLTKAISVGKIGGDHKEMQGLATITLTVESIGSIQHTTLESARGWRFSEDAMQGKYPEVAKLFPEESDLGGLNASTTLDMRRVADAAKVRVPGQVNPAQTDNAWRIGQKTSDDPKHPGPILFTQESETGRARYLLQPLNTAAR